MNYTININDARRINSLLAAAIDHPCYRYDIIIYGFRFSIVSDEGWFEISMHFAPEWSHTVNGCTESIQGVHAFIQDQIADAVKFFTSGGNYPSDYITDF